DFRSAGHRAGWEARAKQVGRSDTGSAALIPLPLARESTAHRRDELMHGREALDGVEIRRGNAADLAHAPEVIAREVDDHRVLGAIFFGRSQLLAKARVFFWGGAARS